MLTKAISGKLGLATSAFTLLEILIAMMIFVVGSVSILSLWIAAINMYRESLAQQEICLLAESLIAEIAEGDLAKNHNLTPIRNAGNKHFPQYKYDMTFADLGQDAVKVSLNIHYNRYGREQQENFEVVLLRYLPKFYLK